MSDGKNTEQGDETKDDVTAQVAPDAEQQSEADTPPAEDTVGEPDTEQVATASTDQKPRRSRLKPVLAVVVIGALAVAAYLLWQQFPQTEAPAADAPQTQTADLIPAATVADTGRLRSEIDALKKTVDSLSQALGDTEQTLSEQVSQTEALESSLRERVDLLDSLPGRVRNTEDALVNLQGISAGSKNAWLLAEAEYYMQIANAQMQLANNPELAAAALELADQRVRELADPAFTEVRRKLASEIASLRTIGSTDIEGVTLTLGSLASMVPGLPLADDGTRRAEADEQDTDDNVTGWARAKRSVGGFVDNMVTIRKSDEQITPMLPPEAEYFLRLNVQLQLQAARLSLLLGETASYQQTLQDADRWLRDYFDTGDSAVQAALKMLEGVADTEFVSTRPDVSGSLKLLRQQRDIEAIAE